MDAISIRCKACKHTMRFSADKVGKKAKCSKCGTLVVIEVQREAAQEAVDAVAPPAVAEPPPVKDEFADDGPAQYDVFVDKELEERQRLLREEEENKGKKKKDKKKLPKVGRKIKPIDQAEEWEKVRIGLMMLFIGTCIWLGTHLLQGIYVLVGTVELSEYANLIATNLEERGDPNLPAVGQFWDVDMFNIYMGMIAGREFAGFAKACLTIASLAYLLQALAWIGAYLFCLPVPRRYGMFGQVMTMLILAFINGLVMLGLKLLPALGVSSYIMIPFVVPEIALTEYNQERQVPIHLLWSFAPFWENFLNLLFKFLIYLEPAFACIFLWSVGMAVKDENIPDSSRGLVQMILGTFFVQTGFHLLSLCGCSGVLIIVLRVFYIAWYCFLLMFILQYAVLLLKVRAVLYEKIHPKYELE